MNNATDIITKEQEEKRLKNFKELAENWDKLPESTREIRWSYLHGCGYFSG